MRLVATIQGAALASALIFTSVGFTRPALGRPISLEPVPEKPRRIIVSTYKTEAAAHEALDALKAARSRGDVTFESHTLVVKEANGKVKVRERRARGTRSGQAVAALTALLGARGGLGVGSTMTAASDYLTSDAVGMQQGAIALVQNALDPGDAAIVTAIDEKTADAAAKLQELGSTRILSHDMPRTVPQPEGPLPSEPVQRPPVVPGSP
jgi:uncharacterized membrane protein